MTFPSVFRVLVVFLCFGSFGTLSLENTNQQCTDEADGACETTDNAKQYICGVQNGCRHTSSIYNHGGGSAQAYKPNAPLQSHVCQPSMSARTYNVATWPWSRRSRTPGPARMIVTVNLWSCDENSSEQEQQQCCCSPFPTGQLEVWHARPDGTYSSITSGRDEGDCRATIPVGTDGKATFDSVTPGSTGVLGGLGPAGWDFMPYGPPVVHMLVTASDHAPALIHLPILMDHRREQRPFWWSEWRGMGYVANSKNKGSEPGYEIKMWKANMTTVEVEIDVHVSKRHDNDDFSRIEDVLCPSKFYGLPNSFFLEPIAICAPSMLDFFTL